MRSDVEFDAEGVVLRGWMYRPDGVDEALPVVVMAHGFSAVKEMYLDAYAQRFLSSGLAVLVYDNRNFGSSDGEPRQEIDPWAQVRDYRHAITYVSQLAGIRADRIGIWGSSYSGGHVLVVGAIDRRVRAVVAQVPLVSGWRNVLRLVRADRVAQYRSMFDADREGRAAGKEPQMVPVVTDDPLGAAALPTPDSFAWFTTTGRQLAPSWRNEVTLRSVEMLTEYEPGTYIERISPTPLLMVVGAADHLTVVDEALGAYNQAREPKRLVLLPGGHFDAYTTDFETSSAAAVDWFTQHLSR
ncbi:MAG: peptidase [Ilumatobacteraceae bacterium]|nr:peptidase [Ilumatobacteraceae bacterium]